MGEPEDSALPASPAPPGVAMVSPNYSSSARTAWVRGEAARAAVPGAGETGALRHHSESRAPAELRASSAHGGGRAVTAPPRLLVPPRSHTPPVPDSESPPQGEDSTSPLLSQPLAGRCWVLSAGIGLPAWGLHAVSPPGCWHHLAVDSALAVPTELPAQETPLGTHSPWGHSLPCPHVPPQPGPGWFVAESPMPPLLPSLYPPACLQCC